ncbi:MAG: hypothetical protein JO107_02855, partial [Hyphomicrobiales bacterium]|nr:hypothetical protein [Hyphomicrobiales bacterium]MBV8662021.1 hypothetical protein [Hyphomicrobiales bacterium]
RFKGADQFKADIPKCVEYIKQNVRYGFEARWAERRNAELTKAGTEFSTAARRIGFPFSAEMWRNVGDDAPVNKRASAENRAMHRAAAAFNAALAKGR